jgi:hypothetical protein
VDEKGLSSFESKSEMELQETKKALERQSSKCEQEKRTEIRQGAMQDHKMPANQQAMGMGGPRKCDGCFCGGKAFRESRHDASLEDH